MVKKIDKREDSDRMKQNYDQAIHTVALSWGDGEERNLQLPKFVKHYLSAYT